MSAFVAGRSAGIATAAELDPRWTRVVARDGSADGTFWYSVATTGVYCRPSCASRTANPRNVQFHDTIAAAEAAGFWACKRCKPNQPSTEVQNAQTVARICRLIEQAEVSPPLAELAGAAGLSPGYFHRVFKTVTGVTPKDYAVARRADKVRAELGRRSTVQLEDQWASTIPDPADDPELALQDKDLGETLQRCRASLSAKHTEVIDLVYYREKTVAEVAAILQLPEATVKTRMFYARRKLAQLVGAAIGA